MIDAPMREVLLPSGAVLKIGLSPFADSKLLYQAVLRELKAVSLNEESQWHSMIKDAFCQGYASLEIERCMLACFKRCLYNDSVLTQDVFEPAVARQDYLIVCTEVVNDNIAPFLSPLYAQWKDSIAKIKALIQASA